MRSIFLVSLGVIGVLGMDGCSGDDKKVCDLALGTGCKEGLVCETAVGGMPGCFQPVQIEGKVIDATSMAGIVGARVVARDVDGAAVSNVAVSIVDGKYTLIVAAPRDAAGVPQSAVYTLRADAQGYQPFPSGIRVSLPIDVKTAMPGAKDKPYTLTAPTTTIALAPIANAAGLGRISGKVSAVDPKKTLVGGTLVVAGAAAMGMGAPTGVADRAGNYAVFNVPVGMQEVRGYLAGINYKPATAAVAAGADTPMVNLTEASAATATVSGSVNIVNPSGGGPNTSVVLIVEETYNTNLERGDVPKGLRASNVANAYSISGVPDGKYTVIPSLDNDGLVRDPDIKSSAMIQHITVAGAPVMVTAFKVTGALAVISPGPTSDPVPVMGNPTFTWQDDSSETSYELVLFDTFGNKIWENLMVPSSSGSNPAIMYPGMPALVKGNYYQFRATSLKMTTPISRTEDLKGIFIAQ